MHKKLSKLADLPKISCEGYVWMSDATAPQRIEAAEILAGHETDGKPNNPFILEAALFYPENATAISVKHVDGGYEIHQFELNCLDPENKVDRVFLAHQALKAAGVRMTEIWVPEKDVNCADMDVRTKQAIVFTGFEKEA